MWQHGHDSRYQEGGRQQRKAGHTVRVQETLGRQHSSFLKLDEVNSGRRANPRSETCCLGTWRPEPSQHPNDEVVLQICLVDAEEWPGPRRRSVPSSPKTRCYVSLRGNRREAACSNLQGVMLSLVIVSITSVSLEGHTKKLLETNIARIRAALRIITHIHSSSTSHSLWNIRKVP